MEKILTLEEDLGGEKEIPHTPYGIDPNNIPEGMEKYSLVYFPAPDFGEDELFRIELFSFEIFKEIYEMEEVTKIKITFRTGFGPG